MDVDLVIYGPLRSIEVIKSNEHGTPFLHETINPAKESASETLTYSRTFSPTIAGTYAICLDNTKSRLTPKIVQLDVRLAPRPEPIFMKSDKKDKNENEEMERIKESISLIQKGFVNIQVNILISVYNFILHLKLYIKIYKNSTNWHH